MREGASLGREGAVGGVCSRADAGAAPDGSGLGTKEEPEGRRTEKWRTCFYEASETKGQKSDPTWKLPGGLLRNSCALLLGRLGKSRLKTHYSPNRNKQLCRPQGSGAGLGRRARAQVLGLLKRGALSTSLHLSVFVTGKIWVMMDPISLGCCAEE